MGLQVRGLDELHRNLTGVRFDLADQREPLAEAAQQTAGIAAHLAPKRTGRLAASITGRATRGHAVITANTSYAAVINYGSIPRHIGASRFLQRAESVERFLSALRRHLDQLIGHWGLS